jgi:hypothetical protein
MALTTLLLAAGACGSGDEVAEDAALRIGTRVTTTTITVTTVDRTRTSDHAAALREQVERSQATTTSAPETATEQTLPAEVEAATARPEHCFAMEQFVFEATQMLVQQNVEEALSRSSNAVTALDTVIAIAPPEMANPARTLRTALIAAATASNVASSVENFNSSVLAMVESNHSLIDDLYATTIEVCDYDDVSERIRSLDGANFVMGG